MKIKGVETKDYSVAVYSEKDYYMIVWSGRRGRGASEKLRDYKTADFMFELKLSELIGQ